MATVEAEALLTVEEYGRRPDPGYPEDLVRGKIVPMPVPNRRHGVTVHEARVTTE